MNIDKIMKAWTNELQEAAVMEGWDLFTATDGSPVQVQRFDDAEELPFGAHHLTCDAEAMMIVRTGTGPHHAVARKILHDHFPAEWAIMNAAIFSPKE
jgi:hypothetical protein